MRKSTLTLMLSFVLAIIVVTALTQQGHAGRGKGRRGAPKVGEMAPSFTLMSLDGKVETDLESFRGKRPVVLFFGSYT